jgi:hypothetical protein
MSRPVSYNLVKKPLEADISMAPMPSGHQGEGFFATSLNSVIGLARKNSIWPLPFATSCCGIEFMATMVSLRLGSFWIGACWILTPSVRSLDGNGNHCQKNGTRGKTSLSANG